MSTTHCPACGAATTAATCPACGELRVRAAYHVRAAERHALPVWPALLLMLLVALGAAVAWARG